MIFLNKLLSEIKKNSLIFKSPELIEILGFSLTQIKDLKKYALEKDFIKQEKQEIYLTLNGQKYLDENPPIAWATKDFPLRPNINVEY